MDTKRRSRKIAAILTAGVVLGLSTLITLATWNDSEYEGGALATGAFNLQGSINGTTWNDDSSTGAAATLPFTVAATATDLSPNDVVYAPFAVRLDGTTTDNATVTITAVPTGISIDNLTYTLFTTSTFGCSAAATPVTTLVPAGTAIGTVTNAQTFSLSHGSSGSPGAAVNLCFKVSAGSSMTPNQSGTAQWRLTASS